MHVVDKHGFPRNYDFFVVNDGMDNRRSMLRSNNDRSHHKSTPMDVQRTDKSNIPQGLDSAAATEMTGFSSAPGIVQTQSAGSHCVDLGGKDIDNITKAMSSLKFLPPSVRFGRGGGRSGFAKQ